MSGDKFQMLAKEILPLAESLCDIAERYEFNLLSITAGSDGEIYFSINDKNTIHTLIRLNHNSVISIKSREVLMIETQSM